MVDQLASSFVIGASGMRAQSERIKVLAQNIANAGSTAINPNDDPYRRKIITFANVMDDKYGVERVRVRDIREDQSDFKLRYEPTHPAADERGYVKYPNVNSLVEATDMQEAQRAYTANLSVLNMTKQMVNRTIQLLQQQ